MASRSQLCPGLAGHPLAAWPHGSTCLALQNEGNDPSQLGFWVLGTRQRLRRETGAWVTPTISRQATILGKKWWLREWQVCVSGHSGASVPPHTAVVTSYSFRLHGESPGLQQVLRCGLEAGPGLSGTVSWSARGSSSSTGGAGAEPSSQARLPGRLECQARSPALPSLGLPSSLSSMSPPGNVSPPHGEEAASSFLTPLTTVPRVRWFSLCPMRVALFSVCLF